MEVEDEWELLSDEGYLEISDDAGKQIYSRNPAAAVVVHTNYFICPPPPQFVETTASRLLPAPDPDQPIQINIESDQDPISQVFFKKMKEAEFVDMKVESPKPSKFEAKEDPCKFDAEMAIENEKDDGANAWKRSLSGIGAICSFGVAAATFCIIVFTNKHPHHHNHKLQFRIYTDDKRRMKVKGAIAAVSGVPISRARITVGGYYDAAI
ncbi:uncharacterized protein LOC130988805 [Salvia miltiorrhiza]|uniref:uncharacterized protein LOC130988805 n=1 Tax=Salvia miltiorrhiza TaxID=226208 RepID=UPI0025AD4C77|nr:uncharacterized protein LOC130988805 [Salvia miltiorrhiza]